MNIIVIFILVIGFYLLRILINPNSSIKGNRHLFVSFIIVCLPLELNKTFGEINNNVASGTLGSNLIVPVPIFIVGILVIFFEDWKKLKGLLKFDLWIKILFIIVLVSFVNPYNSSIKATLVFAVYVFSHFIIFNLIALSLTFKQILFGLYDGLKILAIVQIILAICFPALGLIEVTSIFHEQSGQWATRQGNREGAVGLFVSPGNLALFNIIAISFFLSSYISKFKPSQSVIFLIFNLITLFLTYSRTAYLTLIIVMITIYYINNNATKNIFSLSNILKLFIPVFSALGWLVFYSPLSDLFLKGDSSEQYGNRMFHWLMSFEILSKSPLIGVGINSHLAFVPKNNLVLGDLTIDDFYYKNPIHNIHLIVLAENGILGAIIWLIFIFGCISTAKKSISHNNNKMFALTLIGLLTAYLFYGITGWAPFSTSILPFFLFFTFFALKFMNNAKSVF